MKKSNILGNFLLLLTAIIWGCAFVAQSAAMDSIGPLTFSALRNLLGGLILIPVIIFIKIKGKNTTNNKAEYKKQIKKTIIVGIICGVILTIASLLQQYGIANGTDPGKAGFITALYILVVPILGLLFKKRLRFNQWIGVVIAIIALYMLCIKGHTTIEFNDILLILCAIVFAVHITTIDLLSPGLNGVLISSIQFFTAAILSTIGMLIFEEPNFENIKAAGISILYAGIMSSGVAYTLQIIGQQKTEPTIASLIMSLESVFAVIATILYSVIIGSPEYPTISEWIGCILMFIAIIFAQIEFKSKKERIK